MLLYSCVSCFNIILISFFPSLTTTVHPAPLSFVFSFFFLLFLLVCTGTFGEDDILDFASDAACRWVLKQPQFPRTPFSELFPQAPADALDLLQSLLELRPDRRCSADAALRHPYLADYHDPEEEPVCEDGFHFEFEKSDLDKDTIRGLIRRAAAFVGTVPQGAEVHDVTGGGSSNKK